MTHVDEELLLHRALAGTANDEDWSGLDAIAARDSAVWERLAFALRDDRELAAAVAAVSMSAERVEVPAAAPRRVPRASGKVGWLVAAAVALAAAFSHLTTVPPTSPRSTPAAHEPETVAELPKLFLESRSGPNGVEVYYVKRSIERTVVGKMLEIENDDAGRTVVVPAPITSNARPSAL